MIRVSTTFGVNTRVHRVVEMLVLRQVPPSMLRSWIRTIVGMKGCWRVILNVLGASRSARWFTGTSN